MKALIQNIFERFNVGVTSSSQLRMLRAYETDIQEILAGPTERLHEMLDVRDKSKSQVNQDLFVLLETGFKKNGFFVEFGATNGIDLSNTYLLEKEFGWRGILAEPARVWHEQLRSNRQCNVEVSCVWGDSDSVLDFHEVKEPELSTIGRYESNSDWASKHRKNHTTYKVNTISLTDLLTRFEAPPVVDYLSIDTEGSEFEILKHFDFEKYQFRVITCEHNFMPIRQSIYELLTGHGYQRKFIGLSKWDDWYVRPV